MSSGYKSPYNCRGRRREGRVGVCVGGRESVCERGGWVCVRVFFGVRSWRMLCQPWLTYCSAILINFLTKATLLIRSGSLHTSVTTQHSTWRITTAHDITSRHMYHMTSHGTTPTTHVSHDVTWDHTHYTWYHMSHGTTPTTHGIT